MAMTMEVAQRLRLAIRVKAPFLKASYHVPLPDDYPKEEHYMVIIEGMLFKAELHHPWQWWQLVQQLGIHPEMRPEVLEAWAQWAMKQTELPQWARAVPDEQEAIVVTSRDADEASELLREKPGLN